MLKIVKNYSTHKWLWNQSTMIRDFWRYFQTLWNNFENGQFSWCFNFHLVSQKSLSKVQGLIEIRSDKWWALLKSQVVNFSPTFYKWDFFLFQVRLNFSICLYADSNRCQIGFSAKRSRNIFCQDFFMKNIITTRGNLTMQILVSSWVSCKYSWDFFCCLPRSCQKIVQTLG